MKSVASSRIDVSEKHRGVREVNLWWWALGSFGGSIRKRKNGFFFHPNITTNRKRTYFATIGPFVNLQDALAEAGRVATF